MERSTEGEGGFLHQLTRDEMQRIVDEIVPVAVQIDDDATLLDVSESTAATLGYNQEWLIGKSVDVLLPTEIPEQGDFDIETLNEGKTHLVDHSNQKLTIPFEAADGSIVTVTLLATQLPNLDGKIWVAQKIDNHTPQKSEHHRGDDFFEVISDPMCVLDTDGYFERVNDAFVEYTGYTKNELIGASATKIVTPGDIDARVDEVRDLATVAGEDSATFEMTVQPKGGDDVLTEVNVYARTDDSGETTGIAGVLRNIEDRKQRERRLLEYQELVNTVGDPMYVLDAEGYFERVNEAFVEYTGYDREDLIGRGMGELVPAVEYDQATERLLDLVQRDDKDTARFEISIVGRDGDLVQNEASVTVLTDDSGAYAGSVGSLRNIEERTQRQQELELLKEVLARVFRHNVRNELMVVRGHTEVLEDHVDETLHDHTTAILNTSQRLLDHSEKARLIEQIVDTDYQEEVDLADIVSNVVTPLQSTAVLNSDLICRYHRFRRLKPRNSILPWKSISSTSFKSVSA